jgi:porin-like protein
MAVGRRARKTARSGTVAAALAFGLALAPPTIAADLGGNCCGNLEERIADLEATTARKGNRKVSLTVSGWINEALFWWDDGTQQNVYEGTNMVEQSRVKFLGEAKVDKDWSAGYLLEIAVQGHPNREWNQFTSNSVSSNPVNKDDAAFPRKSYWFLKSKTYGQIAIALNGMATFHLLDDTDPTMTRNIDDAEGPPIFMSAFLIRSNGNFVNKLTWPNILRGFNNSTPGDAARRNVVRYDAPASQGLTLSASWGEDDLWDAALTYKQQFGEFRVVARAGYGASNDPGVVRSPTLNPYVVGGTPCISGTTITTSLPNFECTWEGAAAFLQHEPTGLFLYGGWGRQSVHTAHVFPPGTCLRAGQHDVVHPPRRREEMVRPRTDRDLRELSS